MHLAATFDPKLWHIYRHHDSGPFRARQFHLCLAQSNLEHVPAVGDIGPRDEVYAQPRDLRLVMATEGCAIDINGSHIEDHDDRLGVFGENIVQMAIHAPYAIAWLEP